MKLISTIILLLMFSTTWAESPKIGMVNLEEVLIKSKFYPSLNQKVEAFIELKNIKVVEIDNQIKSKEKALKLGIISAEGQAQSLKEIESLKQEQTQLIALGQKEVDEFEVRLRQPIIKAILAAIKKTAKEKNYKLILEKSSPVLESSLNIEIIDSMVIQELNQ